MLTVNWKKYALSGGIVLATIGSIGGVTALAHGASPAFLEALGITEEQFDAAKDTANDAMINEADADGWITSDEASDLIENDRRLRLGRSPYYRGIYDKTEFLADALDVSVADIEAAKDVAKDAKIDKMIASGRVTAEQVAEYQAVHDFKESIDKDALLATALGISTSELDAYRDSATAWEDVLADVGVTEDEVKEAGSAAMAELVADAVANGELTAEQGEQILERNGRQGRRGRGGRQGRGNRGGNGNAPQAEIEEVNA